MRHLGSPRPPRSAQVITALAVVVALLALTARPALAGFQPQQPFPTSSSPFSVATVDLNGDGRLDLAVARTGAAGVGVLMNTTTAGAATPSFAPQVTFNTGVSSNAVAAADFNGDSKPDLALASFGSGVVSVLLNTTTAGAATPTFAAAVVFNVVGFPLSVVAADLNGDGRPDLAVANVSDDRVGVRLNTTPPGNATPTFAATVLFAAGSTPASVVAADLNGDGRPDLAVANNGSNTVSVLLNTMPPGAAVPAFSPQVPLAVGTTPAAVAAADLNGDGRPDLAVANNGSNTVSVLLNATPSGAAIPNFAAQVTFGAGASPRSVAVADLNGDGKPDLAVANNGDNTVGVLLGNPSGALQISALGSTVAEGAGTATVTLARTGSTDGQVSAIVSVTGGTAAQGQDFTFPAPQMVTWADGDGADKTVTIPMVQDQIDEGDESIQLALSLPANPFGATLGPQTTSALSIADDDPVVLNIANVSVTEGDSGTSNATFTVTRAGRTVRTATVQYATADGSGHAGRDYTATSGTLTFAPGDSSKTVAVTILGDALAEPDEAFTVTLFTPTNATLGVAQAVGIIQNDDAVVACTPRPRVTQVVAVGGGALNVHVESTPLNTPTNNPLRQITFGTFQNATVTLNGQAVTSGQTVSLPPNTVGADLVVRRAAAGQPTTVPFTVVDGCGEWSTFVGGGAAAGF